MLIQATNFDAAGREYGYRPQYVAASPRAAFERFESMRYCAEIVGESATRLLVNYRNSDGALTGSREYLRVGK